MLTAHLLRKHKLASYSVAYVFQFKNEVKMIAPRCVQLSSLYLPIEKTNDYERAAKAYPLDLLLTSSKIPVRHQ